ncbi:diaminopimelate epimerase [Flavobacterium sp.]|jgi:diaminopimelate epimerase|uniref:diaminopimelate epimerase n=1 Tax=Flavobacterium sp. TaxID=239 RepID=UPI0037BEBB88
MQFTFYKYQGTGNDFIMLDNRLLTFPKKDIQLIEQLCDRRFGIGADGLILLESHTNYDFKMVYFNSDGNESSMCGNGGRCLVAFAKQLGIIEASAEFEAVDGYHYAEISTDELVSLQMKEVDNIKVHQNYSFLNTGSPHHVQIVSDLKTLDVKLEGSKIRYSELYGADGSNVNFVHQIDSKTFSVRTYERGVEDETLSCGTGATAVAIAMHHVGKTKSNSIDLQVEGGKLSVQFKENNGVYSDIFLVGPATFVFEGTIDLAI